VLALFGSFVCSLILLREVSLAQSGNSERGFEQVVSLWTWADVANAYELTPNPPAVEASDAGWRNLRIDIALRADALTAIMLAMVTFISSLIAVYASGYMEGDRGYWRFFAYIGLFVFSMTMLVAVSNFVLLFVFWEAVGVCSYLLIGFWYQKPEAAAAGKKAFLVNRVGDFAFTVALFLIWCTYGTLNYHDTLANNSTQVTATAGATAGLPSSAPPQVIRGVLGQSRIATNSYATGTLATAICLLLLLGACGKSAQFPLHVWLPDAMEGPTPVSALIHAATMVTAGVYMVARCTPLFAASATAQLVVACIGGFTALLAGLIALTQFDLKRVLAYSTISQLGYMFLALGAGTFAGVTAGMYHLFTHAFFKALLFLGAGSVMHAMGGVIDMRQFGGLRRLMPHTHWTFLIGCLALSGISAGRLLEQRRRPGPPFTTGHAIDHGSCRHAAPGRRTSSRPAERQPARSRRGAWASNQPPGLSLLYYGGILISHCILHISGAADFPGRSGSRIGGHHAHESPGDGLAMIVPDCSVVVSVVYRRFVPKAIRRNPSPTLFTAASTVATTSLGGVPISTSPASRLSLGRHGLAMFYAGRASEAGPRRR
jgi:NADH:ubiquinone oxidoreductase subunit 5 (subunit L)/multisubunit Na+/H+ antiporter MnhA subunit